MSFEDDLATVQRLVPLLDPIARELRCEGGDARALLKSRFDSSGIDHRNLLVRLGIPTEGHGITPSVFNQAVDNTMLRL